MRTGQTYLTAKGIEGSGLQVRLPGEVATTITLRGPVCENRLTRMKVRLEVRTICQV